MNGVWINKVLRPDVTVKIPILLYGHKKERKALPVIVIVRARCVLFYTLTVISSSQRHK